MSHTELKGRYGRLNGSASVRYDLPHRILSTAVYPIKSPNGSTIVIYGHETGIRVLWHGGRQVSHLSGQLHEEEPEIDPEEPFLPIVHSVDVNVAAEVFAVAVPPVETPSGWGTSRGPAILGSHIILVLACGDLNCRLVVLPLLPDPSKSVSESVSIVLLGGPSGHQDVPTCLAVSWTGTPARETMSDPSSTAWRFIVASSSCEGGGLLLLFDVLIPAGGFGPGSSDGSVEQPVQQVRLAAPPMTLAFNPEVFPAPQHRLLLVADQAGGVRIYDPISDSRLTSPGQAQPGRWLLSHLVRHSAEPALMATAAPAAARTKTIVGANWVFGGSGIIVLTADGEWGVWRQALVPQPNDPSRFRLTTDFGCRFSFLGRVEPDAGAGQVRTGAVSVARLVTDLPGQADEAVVLQLGQAVFGIASFKAYCDRIGGPVIAGQPSSGSIRTASLVRIDSISMAGRQIGSALPMLAADGVSSGRLSRRLARPDGLAWPYDLVVSAGRWLTVVSPAGDFSMGPIDSRPFFPSDDITEGDLADQDAALLRGRVLDIGGLNRQMSMLMGEEVEV